MTVVRVEHCVGDDGMRYCAWGIRAFCRRHGIDLAAFLRDGIDADELERTGDALAIAAARRAREATIRAGGDA